ncbi:type II secretion system protein [Fervidibacter sacchari]|jgi:prepilin-type N-terminal cleavage/methylation domain|uniref:Type II secretory pathway pseudopilin PulG n=1 Tax=Candidatus Fervidibacter sacchari TaxID=1448929 RepID=A0ABT2ETU2_9BACT|nr:type II secretion system protein [Candidatus Fervidibacter sacchari]MCS3921069.1 type II secretory pathway pseudopilin PulG [Candidatus Fervidibacter sacchari]WKU16575.1 type II secretion system protein [Candidatus Fervidibacter sacchari]
MKEQNKFTEHLHAYTLAHLNSYTHAPLHACTRLRLHALTLIELVIVCAIIAVLVGIVWVVMAPAREKARQAVCISNLTQIGHAFRMYRDDWDGVEPQKGVQLEYWEVGLPPEKPPLKTLRPYLKEDSLWLCPDRFLHLPDTVANSYVANYCTHFDVEIGLSKQYDECWLLPGTRKGPVVSFRKMVSFHPDLPILYCESHRYFYFPKGEWEGGFLFGVILTDFSVRRFQWSDYEPIP